MHKSSFIGIVITLFAVTLSSCAHTTKPPFKQTKKLTAEQRVWQTRTGQPIIVRAIGDQ